jgi:hypothetical protein
LCITIKKTSLFYLTFAFLVIIAILSARYLKKKIARKELQVIAENEKECGFKSQPKVELPYLHIALTGAATFWILSHNAT